MKDSIKFATASVVASVFVLGCVGPNSQTAKTTDTVVMKLAKAAEGFAPKVYRSSNGDTLNYRIHLPEEIDAKKQYPLVLFFHGAGERGHDSEDSTFQRHGCGHRENRWQTKIHRIQRRETQFLVSNLCQPGCPEVAV